MKKALIALVLLCGCASSTPKPSASTTTTIKVVVDADGKEVGTLNKDGSYTINGERYIVVLGQGECVIDGNQCVKSKSVQ